MFKWKKYSIQSAIMFSSGKYNQLKKAQIRQEFQVQKESKAGVNV
jgi:hypothetical protein